MAATEGRRILSDEAKTAPENATTTDDDNQRCDRDSPPVDRPGERLLAGEVIEAVLELPA